MASIDQNLSTIKNAVYGIEVRQPIIENISAYLDFLNDFAAAWNTYKNETTPEVNSFINSQINALEEIDSRFNVPYILYEEG